MMEDNNDECHAIVIEYLLHYCYEQSAKGLLKEIKQLNSCNTVKEADFLVYSPTEKEKKEKVRILDEKDIQWDHITARKNINQAIQLGDIAKAFKLIENTFPSLIRAFSTMDRMDTPPTSQLHRVLYKLRCQQFVETLRSAGEIEAIQFAQSYLRPCHRFYADLADSVTCLIAYHDPQLDPYANKMLSQDRRNSIADEVNQMILEFEHCSPQTPLEKLWRQKVTIETELDIQTREEAFKKNDIESREKVSV